MARRFIHSAEVTAVGTEEAIWSKGGAYVFPADERSVKYASDSGNDVYNGTGARSIEIKYLNDEFEEKTVVESIGKYSTNLIDDGDMTAPVAGTDFKNLGVHNSLSINAGVAIFTPTQQYEGFYQDSDGATIPISVGKKYLAVMKAQTSSGTKQLAARLFGIVGSHQRETATVAGTIQTGVQQIETATVVGTITLAGDAKVTITSANIALSPLEVPVAVALNDDAATIASKIRAALALVASITDVFTVGGADATVSLTSIAKLANDATLNIAVENDSCTGITDNTSSADTQAGVASGAGNVVVTITSGYYAENLVVPVAVADGDTAAQVAGKIRTALNAETDVTDYFLVGGSTVYVTLEDKTRKTNDTTLNIATANDTSIGLTDAASSANTVAGLADSPISDITNFDVESENLELAAALITATGSSIAAQFAIMDTTTSDFVEISVDDVMLIDVTALGSYTVNGVSKDYEDLTATELKEKFQTFFDGTSSYQYSIFSDFYRLIGAMVYTTGTGLKNAGNISITNTGGTETYGYIAAGRNMTEAIITTVPKYKQFDIEKIIASSGLAAGGKLSKIELKTNFNFNTKKFINKGTWFNCLCVEIKDENIVIDKPELWFPAGTDIMLVTSGDASAKVACSLLIREP